VFAVDTNEGFLEYIKHSAKEEGLNNIETVLVTEDDLTLPEGSMDLIFMRNVYHHLTNRVHYLKRMKGLMKSEGRIAIIEYRHGGRFSFRGIFGHYVPKEIIIKEMKEVGYQLEEDLDLLPDQSFTVFSCQK
jgi:ubiquinone/menaquinone biosynthesis C-methylase UbiE